MIKIIKHFLCRHKSAKINRWHVCHGITGMEPAMIEIEFICKDCKRVFYRYDSIKNIDLYKQKGE